MNISDLRHPCLEIKLPFGEALLFPQLTLDTRKAYYRLDALACLRSVHGRLWVNIEVDGQGHNSEFDQERQSRLGLRTVRLGASQLIAADLLETFQRELERVVERPIAS